MSRDAWEVLQYIHGLGHNSLFSMSKEGSREKDRESLREKFELNPVLPMSLIEVAHRIRSRPNRIQVKAVAWVRYTV